MSERSSNARWWDEPKSNCHDCLVGVFQVVRDECAWRIDADEYHAGLYCSADSPGVRGESRRGYEYGPSTLPYNVSRSAVDTLQAKIAKHRPLPQVLTSRGNWKNQKRARKQTQYLEGEFYRQRIFEKWAPLIVRDALIFGRGLLKVWTEGKETKTERAHPWEVFTDEWDARYGDPQNIYHVRSMDREVAIAKLATSENGNVKPKLAEAIRTAGRFGLTNAERDTSVSPTVDRVDVLEAWHKASAPGAGDGRHVVVVQGATLIDEEWEGEFPFVPLFYNDPLVGYWGHGLVEQIEGYAYEINMSSEKASEQFRMSGMGVLVPDGSGIHNTQIRNGITILNHKPGMPPQVFAMDLVNEHTRERPRELTQDCLNDVGLSQMSVSSQKPSGITAAVALQTLDDIETERFMIFGRAYETWCLNVARMFVECAKTISATYGDLAVSVPMKGGLVDLKWTDVVLDGMELRIFATSLLKTTPAARLEQLKGLWDVGLVDRATFLRYLDAGDMQAELDFETADRLMVDEILESMLEAEPEDGDKYMEPSAYQDLKWAARRCQQKLNDAQLKGAPDFNLKYLRRFLKRAQELTAATPQAPGANDASAAPLNPEVGGPGPAPGGPPAPEMMAPPMGAAA